MSYKEIYLTINNILQSAVSIKNDHSCVYDTNYGYNCTFTTNGDVAGWDVYDNIYLYGCWNKTLFGTSSATTCYIGRTDNIYPVVAEDFSIFRMMIKIEAPENPYKLPPTNGRVYWKTSADDSWTDSKSEVFTIDSTESWFLCELELNSNQYWTSSITALRITIFEGGYEGIAFAIRYIRLASRTNFMCLNTQCTYYSNYQHPCVGTAVFSTATAGIGSKYYTTVSGVSDTLIVNIDGYGNERLYLGNNSHISGVDMAKKLTYCLNLVDIGAYAYAYVEHTEDNKLRITSGSLPTTAHVPTALDAELVLYVYAYGVSSAFKAALSDIGWLYIKPVDYLHVIYGPVLPFIELIYGAFLSNNNNYYTVAGNLISMFTSATYFTDILDIKASNTLHIFSICGSVYNYNPINVSCPQEDTVYFSFGSISSSTQKVTVTDVTNGDLLFQNVSTGGATYTKSVSTKYLSFQHFTNYLTVNYIFFYFGDGNAPDAFGYTAYGYSDVVYTIDKISSNWLETTFGVFDTSSDSFGETIEIIGGPAAEALGFYYNDDAVYINTTNYEPSSGFDFSSSRRLRYFEIAKLINSDFKLLGYMHKPNKPAVDAGRGDYFEALAANACSISSSTDYYKKLDGAGKIIIDFTHPISDCGRLNNIKIGGSVSAGMVGEVLFFRQYKDGKLTCLRSFTLDYEYANYIYSSNVTTEYLSFDLFLSKGDVVGFKNVDLLCLHSSQTQKPNATLYIIPSETDIFSPFNPGALYSQGVIGPSYYAYSDRFQDCLSLDIDVGKRLNIDKFQLYGKEYGEYFEYNLAACLDMDWKCDLYNDSHTHIITNAQGYSWIDTHQNCFYGLDSLNDCSVTADGGQEGTSWARVNGLATYGSHTYFYVNGDGEWLNSSDGKSEYSYPNTGQAAQAYTTDPISLYLTIPQGKSVDIFKSILYFKESPNFRKMGISYYLGPNSLESFADAAGYRYITNIESVALDGVRYYAEDYTSSDDWTLGKFVTTNPLPDSRISYVNDVAINSDLYNLAGSAYWNVFEYLFEPVNAYGFMVHSDWHESTKIIEIELYSRFKIVPTLIDNVTVRTSVYGDTWDVLSFSNDQTDSTLISAFVDSNPQYFNIIIEPQDDFELYEMSLSLDGGGVGSVGCLESVIPVEAKNGTLSSVSCIEVENIYDVPLHLYVNIPKNLYTDSNLLSWIKLSSEETSFYGEVGPGAHIHKNADYSLVSYDNQVANNCPSYYLKNLIDGKTAYVFEYDNNWRELGTLSVGQAVNYSSKPASYSAVYDFDVVASKYWKVLFGDPTVRTLSAYRLLINSSEIVVKSAYIQVEATETSNYRIPVSFDLDGFVCNTEVFSYTFLDGSSYLDNWAPTVSSGTYFLSSELYGLYPVSMAPGGYGKFYTSLPYRSNSFKVVVDFIYFPCSYLLNYSLRVDLHDVDGNSILYVIFTSDVNNVKMAAYSYNPDAGRDPSGYSVGSYGSATVANSQIGAVSGKVRLVLTKTSRTLNHIKLTSRDESVTYLTITPSRTYFSSRLYGLSFTVSNTTSLYLPEALPEIKYNYSNIFTIVIDCLNNYGGNLVGLRTVNLYDRFGQLIVLTPGTNCTCYQSSVYSTNYNVNYVFNTSTSKTGIGMSNGWLSSASANNIGRLVCVLYNTIDFSEVVITNYHSIGIGTDYGARDIKITVVPAVYENITPMAEIPDGILIYDGSIKKHIATDTADSEFLTIGGVGSEAFVYGDYSYLGVGVNSISVEALPTLSRFDAMVFEFDKVTPLSSIKIITSGSAMDHSSVMISNNIDNGYTTWARNTSKFRLTEDLDASFVTSGYYVCYGSRNLYPYYAMNRGSTVLTVSEYEYFASVGKLPLWIAYDFGQGNETSVHSLWVICYYSTLSRLRDNSSIPLPNFPDTIYVYGSNDSSTDWESKSKDLLATVTGCYNGKWLYLDLNVIIPYRYYCLYAPNLDQSTSDYTLAFKWLTMFTHLDDLKKNYWVFGINNNSTTHNARIEYTDLYSNTSVYTYALGGQPHYMVSFGGVQYVSGIKFFENGYISGFSPLAYVEYSVDTTNGLDGTWTFLVPFNNMETYYDSYSNILYYLLSFTPVLASWVRIYVLTDRVYNITSRMVEIMPIFGAIPSKLTVTNNQYTSYFVIDLEDIYSLDFIRNYGSSSTLLNLFGVELSVGEVSAIEETESTFEQVESAQVSFFITSGTHYWVAPEEEGRLDILIVAGGGAGGKGSHVGGGGGGGGVLYIEDIAFVPGASYELVVGAGGIGSTTTGQGNDGENSSAFGYIVSGGGGGGGGDSASTDIGRSGGSGGGGAGGQGLTNGDPLYYSGGAGITSQGNGGGRGAGYYDPSYVYWRAGGGGGGAGGAGSGGSSNNGGQGGAGRQLSLSGEMHYYGAGGGGASNYLYDTTFGGSYVGGTGAHNYINATNGWDGFGSGGGGSNSTATGPSGSGGCGAVILRFTTIYSVSTNLTTSYATGFTSVLNNVVWNTYVMNSNVDARWVRVPLRCGDNITHTLQYLGVYPDISKAYKKNGGYNCEWLSIGNGLTEYSYSLNVAPQATVCYGNTEILDDVKTVIIDIYNTHGGSYIAVTAVELYDANGDRIYLYYNDTYYEDTYTPYATNSSSTSLPLKAFNNNIPVVGSIDSICWKSTSSTNVRLSCVLKEPTSLSKIVIQNGHHYAESAYVNYGAKTVAIYVSSGEITTTVFNSFSSDVLKVFYGDIPKHILFDVADRYIIDLSSFSPPTDNYFGNYVVDNCIQGDSTLVGYENSWGFKKGQFDDYPTLILKLDNVYNIGSFKLTHSPEDGYGGQFTNISYRISYKHTSSDTYTQLFSITDNDEPIRIHTLDAGVLCQYVKLELLSYTTDDNYFYYDNDVDDLVLITTGFLREFEIWTVGGGFTANSEEHPVVCIDLKDPQVITSHELVLLKEDKNNDLSWDNSEVYFMYSDDITDDPHMVSFIESSGETAVYSKSTSYIDYTELEVSMLVGSAVYLSNSSYKLNWESYNALYTGAISVNIIGPSTVNCANNINISSWGKQTSYFSLDTAGYYNIYVKRPDGLELGSWGVRNLYIVKAVTNTKWLSVKRNTATKHSWSNVTTDYGIDYLSRIRVYAENSYLPTEYPWFWTSTISTLSREHMYIKEGRYSLRVDYPNSSGVDRVDFLEGDHFGWDENWSIKDTLSFWWYISDLANLYIDEGGFGFGCFTGGNTVSFTDSYNKSKSLNSVPAYYLWDFKYMELKSGWNEIKLQFDRNTCTAPLQTTTNGLFDSELNFRENYFTSFGLVYKGLGKAFYMLFDGFKIERNYYNDFVKDDKGLCLMWKEYADIPVAGVTLCAGTIEFWVKLYSSTSGMDSFGIVNSRVLFTLTNNNNEIVCLTIKSTGWFEIGFGGARYGFNIVTLDPEEYDLSEFSFSIDEVFHIAVAWSNDGAGMDNSDTIRLYINNTLLVSSAQTWTVSDTKSALLRLGGGSTILANNNDEDGSAIFSNVKVYDYCKTSFSLDSNTPDELVTVLGNALIQISKDGVTFQDYNSDILPLKYEEVQPGEKVKVYTRIDKTSKLRSADSGTLEVDWEVIV